MKNKTKKILLGVGLGAMLSTSAFMTTGCANIDLTKGELQTYVDEEGQTKNITAQITDNYFTINASGNLVVGYIGYKDKSEQKIFCSLFCIITTNGW